MSKVKLKETVRENPTYPKNGVTQKSYKNTNYHTLSKSYKDNRYISNVWVTENQCEKIGVMVIDRNNLTHTVDRFGKQTKIFNISQTDFMNKKYYTNYMKVNNRFYLKPKKCDLTDYEREFITVYSKYRKKKIKHMLSTNLISSECIEYILLTLSPGATVGQLDKILLIIDYKPISLECKYEFLKNNFNRYSHKVEILKWFNKDSKFEISFDNNFLLKKEISASYKISTAVIEYLLSLGSVADKILENENIIDFVEILKSNKINPFLLSDSLYSKLSEEYPHLLI